ncbi:MAG TPA: hypothetical protein P5565_05310 [Bacteroidia bacterium]|nr:hypothetical protein [Bacteroidia bacterium]
MDNHPVQTMLNDVQQSPVVRGPDKPFNIVDDTDEIKTHPPGFSHQPGVELVEMKQVDNQRSYVISLTLPQNLKISEIQGRQIPPTHFSTPETFKGPHAAFIAGEIGMYIHFISEFR